MLVTAVRLRPTRVATASWVRREVLDQLLVGGGLLERVEVGAVHVLHQRLLERGDVVALAHERRHPADARAGAPRASAARRR